MNKKIIVYLLIIALIVSGGINYKYVNAAKKREILSEHFLYYTYKSSLENYFDSIILIDNATQIKTDPVAMKEKILRATDSLKITEEVFQRAWALDDTFEADISVLKFHLMDILNKSDDKPISDQDIEKLKKITEVAGQIIPEDYNIFGELKESDYNRLVTKDGRFIDDGKTSNQLKLSNIVLENFLNIEEICLSEMIE